MPDFIHLILTSHVFEMASRLVLTSFFWIAGIFSILKFHLMVGNIKHHGFRSPKAVLTAMIVSELGGSFLLITNIGSLGWLGAGWLGVFTFLSIPMGHPFWRFDPPKKMEEMQIALEHMAVIGGLMAAAALSVG